jgi:polysaccharide export outer membrane protein
MRSVRLRPLLLAVALTPALAACGGRPVLGGDPQLRVVQGTELPAPQRIDATSNASPYYVGPFDKLTIDVFGVEELSDREYQVDASGRLSFPLAGIVDVNGKVPGEVEEELAARLQKAHVRNPQVTVNVKEAVSRVVTVEGQVKKPGLYPVVGRMTLMGAIAKAEGTDDYAKLDDVVVFRTVGGQRYAALYNLDAIRHGAYSDPEIYASDVVMVGDSPGRRLFKDILTAMPALVTPIVIGVDRLTN